MPLSVDDGANVTVELQSVARVVENPEDFEVYVDGRMRGDANRLPATLVRVDLEDQSDLECETPPQWLGSDEWVDVRWPCEGPMYFVEGQNPQSVTVLE